MLRVKRPHHGFAQGGDGNCKTERAGQIKSPREEPISGEKHPQGAEWTVISIKRQETRLALRNLGQEGKGAAEIQEESQYFHTDMVMRV